MPIKDLYVCDFCGNETTEPNDNWHRLHPAKRRADGMIFGLPIILCNACKDHFTTQIG